ncbi:hypothetical protein ACIOJ9_29300 [Streptomyces sp. NPDC088175]|uniref:hypothetical protein n=1 Tax=unclassified Streptomyces TaxID=2593676 RepID=UPI003819A00B
MVGRLSTKSLVKELRGASAASATWPTDTDFVSFARCSRTGPDGTRLDRPACRSTLRSRSARDAAFVQGWHRHGALRLE